MAAIVLASLVSGGSVGFGLTRAAFQQGIQQGIDTVPSAVELNRAPGPGRVEGVSADDDAGFGPEDAPVLIVEFSDFHCPYCKRWHDETLPALVDRYGGSIRLVYRDFPVVGGQMAAEASECAHEQGAYWDYHAALFENSSGLSTSADFVRLAEQLDAGIDLDQFHTCIETGKYREEVAGDLADGRKYGVSGTPTFFINGVMLVGAQPLSQFEAVIDLSLADRP